MNPKSSGPAPGLRILPGDRPSIVSPAGEATIRFPKFVFWPIARDGGSRDDRRGAADREKPGESKGRGRGKGPKPPKGSRRRGSR